jgi:uncharacterized damage-inducible protein DinB
MNAPVILEAVREVLAQGEALLAALDDVAYAQKVPQAFQASLGGHYRHCLDHFSSVFDGLDDEEADYDARKRDARLETVRQAALEKTRELRRRAENLPEFRLDRFIWVRSKVSYAADDSPRAASTVGRELMFCVVHAIHHYALMGVMCGLLEVPLPAGFGVAPSTLEHRRETSRLAA